MIFLALIWIIFATDPLTVRDLSIEYLRTFDCEIAPEKAFLVNQAEFLLTKLAVMESRYLNEDRLTIMHGWTDFVASLLDRTDLEERDINIISAQMMQIQPFDRFYNLTSVIIELHFRILGLTGIDVLSIMPSETIENQSLIHSILAKVSVSTIAMFHDAHRWLVDKSPHQLEFMDHAATFLINDCLRIQAANPTVLMLCYPMHSLLRMDLKGMTVNDLMMGPQYEKFERLFETFRPLFGSYQTRVNFYEDFAVKRKMNPGAVTTVFDHLISLIERLGSSYLMDNLRRTEQALLEVTEGVPCSYINGHNDDVPVGGGLAKLSFKAVLSFMELSTDSNMEAIRAILAAWDKTEPSPSLMLIVLGELLGLVHLKGEKPVDRCFYYLSRYIRIEISQINRLNYSNDPRTHLNLDEKFVGIIERFRRPSFLYKSLDPHFHSVLSISMTLFDPAVETQKRVVDQASRILAVEQCKPIIDAVLIPEHSNSVVSFFYRSDIDRELEALRLEILQTRDALSWSTAWGLARLDGIVEQIQILFIFYDLDVETRSHLEDIIVLCNRLVSLPNMRTRRFTKEQVEAFLTKFHEIKLAVRGRHPPAISAGYIENLRHFCRMGTCFAIVTIYLFLDQFPPRSSRSTNVLPIT
jgi:hypothetical protein